MHPSGVDSRIRKWFDCRVSKFLGIMRNYLAWLFMVSIVVLSVASSFILEQRFESITREQQLKQQLVLARAQKTNTITFFEKIGNSVSILAQTISTQPGDENIKEDLKTFIEQRREMNILGGAGITDKYGVYKLSYNISGISIIGQATSDRDFFLWARDHGQKGEYFISQPYIGRFGPSKGQTIISVASPLYKNGAFNGIVVTSVRLQPLLERFFGLMRISDQTEIYIFNSDGLLLYDNFNPEAVGSKLSEVFSDDQSSSNKIKEALNATEGGYFLTKDRLVAYSPIKLVDQGWLSVVSSPTEEVENLTRPFYFRLVAVLILTSFTILLFGVMTTRRNKPR